MKNLSISSSKHDLNQLVWLVAKIGLFSIFPVVVCLVAVAYFSASNRLPAPILTGRLSFDEKARLIRQSNLDQVDIMLAGSSVALNNPSSQVFEAVLDPSQNYFNFGAWGLRMRETERVLSFFAEKYEPDIVILVTNPVDFYDTKLKLNVNFSDYNWYIDGGPTPYFYFKYHDQLFLERVKELPEKLTRSDILLSLAFDEYGGVQLTSPESEPELGANTFQSVRMLDVNYDALERIASRVTNTGASFVIVQSPSPRFYFDLGAKGQSDLALHLGRLKALEAIPNVHFIDMHSKLSLEDRYFFDYSHLNEEGSTKFTSALVDELVEQQIIKGGLLD